eukprot:1156402-Pelagomonas_calceolata.AAC.3
MYVQDLRSLQDSVRALEAQVARSEAAAARVPGLEAQLSIKARPAGCPWHWMSVGAVPPFVTCLMCVCVCAAGGAT